MNPEYQEVKQPTGQPGFQSQSGFQGPQTMQSTPAPIDTKTSNQRHSGEKNAGVGSGIASVFRKIEGAGDYLRHTFLSHVERAAGNPGRADECERLAQRGMDQMSTGHRQPPVTNLDAAPEKEVVPYTQTEPQYATGNNQIPTNYYHAPPNTAHADAPAAGVNVPPTGVNMAPAPATDLNTQQSRMMDNQDRWQKLP